MNSFSKKVSITKTAKKRMMPLYPTQLEKRRYVVFEMLAEQNCDGSKISIMSAAKAINDTLLYYCGKVQYAKTQLQYLPQLSTATAEVFRVNNGYEQYLRASFCMIDEIEKTKVIIRSALSTGILDKAKKCINDLNIHSNINKNSIMKR
jgi:RNase P/RNase MRP subunit POP5